jgi:hypothetical protein
VSAVIIWNEPPVYSALTQVREHNQTQDRV